MATIGQHGEEVPFYGYFPNFTVMVDGVNDIYMNGQTPVKSVEGITKYRIILDNIYIKDDVTFEVSYEIVYDLIKWQSYVLGKVKCNKTTQGKLYVIAGGKREINPIADLVAGNVYSINQFMGVV